jgi:outer membrane lipoprotein carrier protein
MKRILTGLLTAVALEASGIVLPAHFKASFQQTVTNPNKHAIHYAGEVLFSQKNHLKWSYTEPTKKEVCTDGKEVLVVDHDLEQVSAYRIGKGFDMATILRSAKEYRPQIFLAKYQGRTYTVKLDREGRLESIAYYDDLDNKVQILFSQMHYSDRKVAPESMQCDYPGSYDVIRG